MFTITVIATAKCDTPDCDSRFSINQETTFDVLKRAKNSGWRLGSPEQKNHAICPHCCEAETRGDS